MADYDPTRIARNFADIAMAAGDVLADPSTHLTDAQANALHGYQAALFNFSNIIVSQDALTALRASPDELGAIERATSAAATAVQRMRHEPQAMSSLFALLGDTLELGAACAQGNLGGALVAANRVWAGQGNQTGI